MAAQHEQRRPADAVDVMLVNPPSPDGGIWIRSQHRVGRRSRENMVWPQVSLAQMAALLHPTYKVKVVETTGAGDAFNGAFAVAIGEGRAAVDAMRFACACAALSVTKAGTAPSMPRRGEIDAMMATTPV